MTGKQRFLKLMAGQGVDRQPICDALRNEAIIGQLAGRPLTFEQSEETICQAIAKVFDGTRMLPKLPVPDHEETLPDGRRVRYERWQRWTEERHYNGPDEYFMEKRRGLDADVLTKEERGAALGLIQAYQTVQEQYFDEMAFFWTFDQHDHQQFAASSPTLISRFLTDLYVEIGLEQFSLYLYQDPRLMSDLMERAFAKAMAVVELLPETGTRPVGVFIPDDLAFKGGPLISPQFFEREYFPRLAELVAAIHRKGCLVKFHSDGDVMLLLDGLAESGIDLLHPIEFTGSMNIREIHRRYPGLVLCGGIDAHQLLCIQSPKDVREAVRRAIDEAEAGS